MKLSLLLIVLSSLTFTSCSLFLGGIVALDNNANKGEREIKYEEAAQLRNGSKIILVLNDSTKVCGVYKGHREYKEAGNTIQTITLLDKNDVLKFINTSDVSKIIYIDEGGNVWKAVSIGAIFDAVIIYSILKNPGIGMSGKVF
jgi:hypothetical protein